jgi:hypothetical protein
MIFILRSAFVRSAACGMLVACSFVGCKNSSAPTEGTLTAAPAASLAEPVASASAEKPPKGPGKPAEHEVENRGTSPYCKAPAFLAADATTCPACEKAQCGAEIGAGCESLKKPEDRATCMAALTCVRTTNCMKNGILDCYCGPAVDIGTCRSAVTKAEGPCKAEIVAAFPAGSSADFIIDNSTKPDVAGGMAMSLAQCDFTECGNPVFRGNWQCFPYCGSS